MDNYGADLVEQTNEARDKSRLLSSTMRNRGFTRDAGLRLLAKLFGLKFRRMQALVHSGQVKLVHAELKRFSVVFKHHMREEAAHLEQRAAAVRELLRRIEANEPIDYQAELLKHDRLMRKVPETCEEMAGAAGEKHYGP